jgi:hypothetical protein
MRDFLREDVLIKACILAAVSAAAAAPNIVDSYFFNPGYREALLANAPGSSLPLLFARDMALVFFSLLISSACGFAWADGKKVVGFGTLSSLRQNLKLLLILGPLLAVVTTLLLEKGLIGRFPKFYPRSFLVAFSIPLRSAFFEEVICRFGILMIVFRLSRSVTASVLISSAFNAALGLKSAVFVGFPVGFDIRTAAILTAKFCLAAFFGYFYCKKGLMATISLKFIMELKHIVLALIATT